MPEANQTYEARVRITSDVSVDHTTIVTVGRMNLAGSMEEKGREASKRPAFDFTALSSDFAKNFAKMAKASSKVTSYSYASKPDMRDVAVRYVEEKLGSEWSVAAGKWPSRWTPEGWAPYLKGDPGETYALNVASARPGAPYVMLRRRTSRRHFYLQFFISVEIV